MDRQTKTVSKNTKVADIGFTLSTADIPTRDRHEWLEEMIRQEFTKVQLTPPDDGDLFNEVTFYDWEKLRLSVIRSHEITIERLQKEPYMINQDNYLAVVLLAGKYRLQQDGRETFLQPGDMTIYDATRPHHIECTSNFSKLIVTIPRAVMRDRINGAELCTARRISGSQGVGLVAANFLRNTVSQLSVLDTAEFTSLSEHYLDLLTMSLASVRSQDIHLSRNRSSTLRMVKEYIELHLADPELNTAQISVGVRLSQRYLNDLFGMENTSLMRFVWTRRLECCRRELINSTLTGRNISDIAFRWGFNDFSHFSRAFKRYFGVSPRDIKQLVS